MKWTNRTYLHNRFYQQRRDLRVSKLCMDTQVGMDTLTCSRMQEQRLMPEVDLYIGETIPFFHQIFATTFGV